MKATRTAKTSAPAYVAALPALWGRLDVAKGTPSAQRRNALHAVHEAATAAGVPSEHAFWRKLGEAGYAHEIASFC